MSCTRDERSMHERLLAGDRYAIEDLVQIGAGSVVTKHLPADVVAVGDPTRVVRSLPQSDSA
ncbi:hypothetical protein [Nocardioides sp.]|uniref:hypothetical protein n=1 Tax=Nocardioides sp. TaxID=35761 RepID=UPI00286A6DBE|nr:hypothetical protein [Nocardioides sp.]